MSFWTQRSTFGPLVKSVDIREDIETLSYAKGETREKVVRRLLRAGVVASEKAEKIEGKLAKVMFSDVVSDDEWIDKLNEATSYRDMAEAIRKAV